MKTDTPKFLRAEADKYEELSKLFEDDGEDSFTRRKEYVGQLRAAADEIEQLRRQAATRPAAQPNELDELRRENARLKRIEEAARCIRHWHDAANDGMIVSAEHVRKLWAALAEGKAS